LKKSSPGWALRSNGRSKPYPRPIIPLLIGMIAGIYLGYILPGHQLWGYFLFGTAAFGLLLALVKNKSVFISPIILFAALGYLGIQPWVSPKFSKHHIIHYADSRIRQIVGIIESPPVAMKNRLKFVLKTEAIDQDKVSHKVSGKINVSMWGKSPHLAVGDRISFSARIKPPRNFNNPGRFDYERYMRFNKIWGIAHTQAQKVIRVKNSSAPKTIGIINAARLRISDHIHRRVDHESKGVLKALIIGDRDGIPPKLREAFNRAGVGHLLAISGLHVGIIATVAFAFFRRLLSYIPAILRRAWTRKAAAVFALVPVLIYGFLAGMAPSTQRAVIMVGLFLLTFLLEKEPDLINTLAAAALLILICNPPALFAISFQLSFAAVLAIIIGMSHISERYPRFQDGRGPLNLLIVFILVSFFATLGTLPLVMLYFNQVSLIGLLANIFLIPLIGFMVVPLGLVAAFIFPLSQAGAGWFFNLSAALLDQALRIVNFFAEFPLAAVKTFTPTVLEVFCFYLGAWALLRLRGAAEGPEKKWAFSVGAIGDGGQPAGPVRRDDGEGHGRRAPKKIGPFKLRFRRAPAFRLSAAEIAAVILVVVAVADAGYWTAYRLWHRDLRVTVIDVGQGQAALLEIPGGYNLLIDGGGFSDNSSFDVGAGIVAPLLWRKKIKTVDTLILSHPNSDHLNGLLYIAEHFKVKQVWSNSQRSGSAGYQNLMEIIAEKRITAPDFRKLPREHKINGVTLKVLYPPADFLERKKKDKWRNYNNNSLVVQVQMGLQKFLFPGDIMSRAETELAENQAAALKSTVLIAPHHGSRKSSSGVFLDKVDPKAVIVSAGWKNRFNFPHPAALARYKRRGYRLYRTDLQGAITLKTDGNDLTIRPFLNSPDK